MNFVNLNVNCHVAKPVHTAPGLSQKKELSPGLADCYLKEHKIFLFFFYFLFAFSK